PPLQPTGGFFAKSFRYIGDGAGWRGLTFGLFDLGWGIVTFTTTIVVWAVPLQLLTAALYQLFIPNRHRSWPYRINAGYELTGWGLAGVISGSVLIG
ncbi:MAG TPA: sensor domain-containing protein, partial [Ilumatobacteraceae bacterium]|nr:sensor domain-containing protein [Ilumatobacteraceae bacterium]